MKVQIEFREIENDQLK